MTNAFPTRAAIEATIRRIVVLWANEIRNYIKDNFERKSFDGDAWKKRKDNSKRGDRPILVDTGLLRKSITVNYSTNTITISSPLPYAVVHNEGLSTTVNVPSYSRKSKSGKTTTVKSHSKKMNIPKRQFFGQSKELDKRLEKIADAEISKLFGT